MRRFQEGKEFPSMFFMSLCFWRMTWECNRLEWSEDRICKNRRACFPNAEIENEVSLAHVTKFTNVFATDGLAQCIWDGSSTDKARKSNSKSVLLLVGERLIGRKQQGRLVPKKLPCHLVFLVHLPWHVTWVDQTPWRMGKWVAARWILVLCSWYKRFFWTFSKYHPISELLTRSNEPAACELETNRPCWHSLLCLNFCQTESAFEAPRQPSGFWSFHWFEKNLGAEMTP